MTLDSKKFQRCLDEEPNSQHIDKHIRIEVITAVFN